MNIDLAKLLSAFSASPSPVTAVSTSLLGGVLMLFFYLRKQEKGLRVELVASLVRLQGDKDFLIARITKMQAELDERESKIDALRGMRRDVEDKLYEAERLVEDYLKQLRAVKRGDTV